MSLQGSFQTIALTDVMALLASSNKSGELRVVGGHVEGRLWIHDGRLVESKVGKAHEHVDAMFELMRLSEGNFVFKDGVEAPAPEEATPIESVVHDAEERLREWRDIEQVVPSLEHRVRLIPDLPTAEVTLTAQEWRLVMAIALAATVHGVLEELALGQFEGCRGIRRLVDAGLVLVEPPRVRPSGPDPARLARRAAATSNGSSDGLHGLAEGSLRLPRVSRHPAPAPAQPAGASAGSLVFAPATFSQPEVEAVPEMAAPGSATSLGDLSSFVEGLGRMTEHGDDELQPTYGEQDDLDVVYFPVVGDEYDTSLFAVAQPPEPSSVAPPAPDEPAPEAHRSRWSRKAVPSGHDDAQSATSALAAAAAAAAAAASAANGHSSTAPVNGTDHGSGAPGLTEPDPEGETLNRGLLLKFLSSVRS